MLRIGVVAGEASGDMLGAGLLSALNDTISDYTVAGIGGEKLANLGMDILYPMEHLSVIGITEVFSRYINLSKIRRDLCDYFIRNEFDLFIGIDAPDFNLGLEQELRRHGIKTVHYVSPSVWAWRRYRLAKIHAAVDLILCLFPFEAKIYDQYGTPNCYVGHPLADQLTPQPDTNAARHELDLPWDKTIVALLPGSRANEIENMAMPMLQAAQIAKQSDADIHFVVALLDEKARHQFTKISNKQAMEVPIYIGKTHRVIEAADVVMLASGTVTLEAMLLKKPMVVAYRVSWFTYFILKMLVHIPYVALPNILAGKQLVPECLQSQCTPKNLSVALNKILHSAAHRAELVRQFSDLSQQLKRDANQQASNAVMALLKAQ